jgi:hypothetical protein
LPNLSAATAAKAFESGVLDIGVQKSVDDQQQQMSDCARLKVILDEIRTENYRDFVIKSSRSLDLLRREHGEGRRMLLLPGYMIMKVLLSGCDGFWDKANLSERCVGRMASKGVIIFPRGIPQSARALFCIAAACQLMSRIPLQQVSSCYI